jgi:uncharacterized protein YwlG (UPF0340 family)
MVHIAWGARALLLTIMQTFPVSSLKAPDPAERMLCNHGVDIKSTAIGRQHERICLEVINA